MKSRFVYLVMAVTCACGPDPVSGQAGQCDPDNAGLTVPDGFCAAVFARDLGRARHLTVAANGDVFVAISRGDGGAYRLRDTDGNGVADERVHFGEGMGSDVELHGGFLYYSSNGGVWRYSLDADGAPVDPQVIVSGLPDRGGHSWGKSMAFRGDTLIVNVGSRTNSCQVADREANSPGNDPCVELETRAGLWAFDANTTGQTFGPAARYATGMRNTIALVTRPQDGRVYALMHGRDQLSANWGNIYNDEQNAELPSEEFVRVERGDDFGWPYCYFDHSLGTRVTNPEYGGDGSSGDRCGNFKDPLLGFPGHWAPNGIVFYGGEQFPERYRGGAFVAFHGSWNRAPLPQQGYNVVFVPFTEDDPAGDYEVFADGFRDSHRPVGVAVGPDGSLFVSDDAGGTIFRISYRGS